MLSLFFLASLFLLPSALSAPTAEPAPAPALINDAPESIAIHKRDATNYWQNWSEQGSFNCRNEAGGRYTITWNSNTGGFVCGKGWRGGGNRSVPSIHPHYSTLGYRYSLGLDVPRVVKYSGTYTPKGPGYLAVYGWTRNPLIEYYVVESYDILAPGEPWTSKGNFTFEEGTYQLYQSTRNNKPSIEGTRTFQQYWSVRTEKRAGGSVSMQKHIEAWSSKGMKLGNHEYMVLATEGFTNGQQSSGTSDITVS